MYLTSTFNYTPNDTESIVLSQFGYNAYKLWNIANYQRREWKEDSGIKYPNWYIQKKELKNNFFYKNLPSQTAQQVLKTLDEGWKSYFKLLRTGGIENPRPPKYKQSDIHFTFVQNGIKVMDDKCTIRFTIPKSVKKYLSEKYNLKINYLYLKAEYFKKFSNIKQIRFLKLKNGDYRIAVVHEVKTKPVVPDNGRYLFIDFGIRNLISAYDNGNDISFIAGRRYLSIERYYQKEISYYQSINSKQQIQKGIKYPKPSKRIDALYVKKNNSINDYLHKVTRYITNYCIKNNVSKVIVGYISHIRDSKEYRTDAGNQQLHGWPFAKLTSMLEYKLKLEGISLIKVRENYSSQCSPYSIEVSKKYAVKENRKQRGLYKDTNNSIYNADIVGAYNIGRLAYQKKLIEQAPTIISKNALSRPFVIKVAV